MSRKVEGKVALVTGGASRPGLGFAIAERLAEEGAIVVLTDIDAGGVAESAGLICEKNLAAEAMEQNVASEADWTRVVDDILERHGRLDIVVNNAGILDIAEIAAPEALAGLRKQLEVNLVGCFLGTQAGVRAMRAGGHGGAIVNLSSVAGKVGFRASASYAATKGAVKLMTKSVALETAAEGIRVNSVHPGIILTNMAAQGMDENSENYDSLVASIPAGRLGDPRDIANCVLFLASDEAAYCNGAEFVVDGGYTAQ